MIQDQLVKKLQDTLTEYKTRKDILSKGVTKKGNKITIKPKYKNA